MAEPRNKRIGFESRIDSNARIIVVIVCLKLNQMDPLKNSN